MSRLEDLVRAAQETQAERAAPADRIRQALPGLTRLRRRRQRRWGAAAVVAAAIVAITVPVVVVHRSAAGVATKPCPTTMPYRAPGDNTELPPAIATVYARFAPGWLPAGYTGPTDPTIEESESRYHFAPTGIWTAKGTGASITVSAQVENDVTAGQVDRTGRAVDVNGHTGYSRRSPGGRTASVDWALAQPPVVLTVSAALPEADLLRVARSVAPDWARRSYHELGGFAVPLCGLPAGLTSTLSGGFGSSVSYCDLYRGADSITVYSAAKPWVPVSGDTFRLAGFPARRSQSPDGKTTYLLVELPHSRFLTLIGTGFTHNDLAHIVTTTHLY